MNGERARRPALRGALPFGAPFRGQAVEVLSSCPRSDSRGGLVAEGTSSHSADPLSRPLRASPSGQPPRPQPPPRRPALARSLWLPGPPSPGLNYCNVRSWLGPLPKVEQVHLPAGREQNRSTGRKGSVCFPEVPMLWGCRLSFPAGGESRPRAAGDNSRTLVVACASPGMTQLSCPRSPVILVTGPPATQ